MFDVSRQRRLSSKMEHRSERKMKNEVETGILRVTRTGILLSPYHESPPAPRCGILLRSLAQKKLICKMLPAAGLFNLQGYTGHLPGRILAVYQVSYDQSPKKQFRHFSSPCLKSWAHMGVLDKNGPWRQKGMHENPVRYSAMASKGNSRIFDFRV